MTEAVPAPQVPAPQADPERRAALLVTATLGAAGAAAGAVPYIASWGPSEREKAAGSAVDVDISTLAPGRMKVVEWRGKPIWILRRTPAMIEDLRKDTALLADPRSERTSYPVPPYALKDPDLRSIRPEVLVVFGICTHLGCSPSGPFDKDENAQLGAEAGFVCPCHGSTFDLAGRVFRNKPAADNLPVPPHFYVAENVLRIGEDGPA